MIVNGYEIKPYAKLRGAGLRYADLRDADLQDTNLRGADLRYADLRDVDLRGADLRYANLQGTNLRGADLWDANLQGTNLRGADLRDADLRYSNFQFAKLQGANLQGVKLQGSDLRSAGLQGANLEGATLPKFQITPKGYPVYGFKKLKNGVVAVLKIPAEADRTASLVGRKCRAEYVEVVSGEGYDRHTGKLYYNPGATVYPDKYDGDIRMECTHGIHFFQTYEEAEGF